MIPEAFLPISPAPQDCTRGQLARSLGTFVPVFPQARCPFHKFAATQAAVRLNGLGGYKARSNRWGRELTQARP